MIYSSCLNRKSSPSSILAVTFTLYRGYQGYREAPHGPVSFWVYNRFARDWHALLATLEGPAYANQVACGGETRGEANSTNQPVVNRY